METSESKRAAFSLGKYEMRHASVPRAFALELLVLSGEYAEKRGLGQVFAADEGYLVLLVDLPGSSSFRILACPRSW